MKKSQYTVFFFLTLMTLTLVSLTQAKASIVNVPNTLTAPVMLYDEGGNILADGSYEVTITLKDASDSAVYEEEQEVNVVNGVAAILIGQGYVPGTNHASAAGGLSVETFNVSGDVSVEILVDGQSSPQQIATLSSQPYSLISEYAISVASDAITTESIQDGTIIVSDLDPSFLAELQTTSLVSSSGSAITASDIAIPESTSLNNSGETTVNGVLEDFDSAIDTLRNVNIDQSIDTLSTEIAATYVKKDGTTSMTGDFNMGTKAITSVGNVDGVDVSALSATVSSLDSTYTTDAALSTHATSASDVHGVDSSSSLVGTTSTQTLTNKTITSTNSISGNAINSDTVDETYIDSDIARDSEVTSSVSALETSLGSIASQTYEEGTYTPVLSFDSGGSGVVPAYTSTAGRYTRIGRQVFLDVVFTESAAQGETETAGSGTGWITLSLPFPKSSHLPEIFPCGTLYNSTDTSWKIVLCATSNVPSIIYLYKQTSSSVNYLTGSDQDGSTRGLRLKFNYEI